MSAPLKPHWVQPSHPAIQEVLIGNNGDSEFTTKSISRVDLPPFALFAPMSSPPVTPAAAATYATVQVGRNQHINLNSDLLYINHSCEPSLLFDTSSRNVWVGPKGLRVGDELTFFYPSTEWDMAQPFSCFCGTPSCRGRISGARNMSRDQLAGLWLNGHIWELIHEQQQQQQQKTARPENGTASAETAALSAIEKALREELAKAEESLHKADQATEAARRALAAHRSGVTTNGKTASYTNGTAHHNGTNGISTNGTNGSARHGTSSRELGGELGGDTIERT
ncbi:hypothetical protein SEUCBS139899_005038 [Sporothrix eucalyptigena]|uniref:Post-SET domain-containing protein n=1 Tax=Sporothrix eucalyptigena TaxID=1812306 RepID=A0ABP0AWU4_9PEZI